MITVRTWLAAALVVVAGVAAAAPGATANAPPAAIAPLVSALSAHAADPLSLIDAALHDNRVSAARALIDGAHLHAPEVELALRLGECALASDQLDEAASTFAHLEAEPQVGARALQGFGIAELRRGHDVAAIHALNAAVAGDPKLVRAWTALGVAADRTRNWSAADRAYGHALALVPDSESALANRGYSRLLRGNYAEAAEDLRAALVVHPGLESAQTNLRLTLALQGDYKAAFKGSNRTTLARDLNTIGFAAMARGDYAAAEGYFNRAMELSPAFDRTAWNNLIYLKNLTGRLSGENAPGR